MIHTGRPYAVLYVIPALKPPATIMEEPGFFSQDGGEDTWVSLRSFIKGFRV